MKTSRNLKFPSTCTFKIFYFASGFISDHFVSIFVLEVKIRNWKTYIDVE